MLTRVAIKNYKSIASCDVELGRLMFLVGLNGAGKSNFIDALCFCRDALRGPLDQAFAARSSNVQALSHVGEGQATGFAMRLDLALTGRASAHYSFAIKEKKPQGFEVSQEECVVKDLSGEVLAFFAVADGNVRGHNFDERPVSTDDRLYLVNASGASPFKLVYDALEGMEFYNPDPKVMKVNLDTASHSDFLKSDGSNLASVCERIGIENAGARKRVDEYMRRIMPGLRSINSEECKAYRFMTFEQQLPSGGTKTLMASSMSNGTLRALAVLTALFQKRVGGSRPTTVGIEEPETGLHPSGAGLLLEALKEGAELGQVLVTSHSPDLLHNPSLRSESLLAVDSSQGATRIACLDSAGRSTLADRFYTPGELLRMDQLKPSRAEDSRELFEAPALCSY